MDEDNVKCADITDEDLKNLKAALYANRATYNKYKLIERANGNSLIREEVNKNIISYSQETLAKLKDVVEEDAEEIQTVVKSLKDHHHYLQRKEELQRVHNLHLELLKKQVECLEHINELKLRRLPEALDHKYKYEKILAGLNHLRIQGAVCQVNSKMEQIPHFCSALNVVSEHIQQLRNECVKK